MNRRATEPFGRIPNRLADELHLGGISPGGFLLLTVLEVRANHRLDPPRWIGTTAALAEQTAWPWTSRHLRDELHRLRDAGYVDFEIRPKSPKPFEVYLLPPSRVATAEPEEDDGEGTEEPETGQTRNGAHAVSSKSLGTVPSRRRRRSRSRKRIAAANDKERSKSLRRRVDESPEPQVKDSPSTIMNEDQSVHEEADGSLEGASASGSAPHRERGAQPQVAAAQNPPQDGSAPAEARPGAAQRRRGPRKLEDYRGSLPETPAERSARIVREAHERAE